MNNSIYRIITLFILVFIVSSCDAQDRISNTFMTGVWQSKNPDIGSAYNENYQFFEDGEFIFNTSQYDELNRVISIKGNYYLKSDSLIFVPLSLIEDIGSNRISRSRTTSINDSWSLRGNFEKAEKAFSDVDTISVSLSLCGSVKNRQCVLIEGSPFYKILDNPNDY